MFLRICRGFAISANLVKTARFDFMDGKVDGMGRPWIHARSNQECTRLRAIHRTESSNAASADECVNLNFY